MATQAQSVECERRGCAQRFAARQAPPRATRSGGQPLEGHCVVRKKLSCGDCSGVGAETQKASSVAARRRESCRLSVFKTELIWLAGLLGKGAPVWVSR